MLIVLMVSLACLALWMFFVDFLPFLVEDPDSPPGLCIALVALWIWINSVYNYYRAVTLNPGYYYPLVKDTEASRFCDICNQTKPPNVHHCSHCRKCIANLDHHCPYTNNCVTRVNYLYFYMFVTYLWLGGFFATLVSFVPFKSCVWPGFWSNEPPQNQKCYVLGHKSLIFIPTYMGAGAVSCLWLLQTILLRRGLSTFDWWTQASEKGEIGALASLLSASGTPVVQSRTFTSLVLGNGRRSLFHLLLPYPPPEIKKD